MRLQVPAGGQRSAPRPCSRAPVRRPSRSRQRWHGRKSRCHPYAHITGYARQDLHARGLWKP